jgi:hypothetical protein
VNLYVQEENPRTVEKDMGLRSGALESLKERASGFAGMVAAFCQRLGLWHFELLVSKFQVFPAIVADPIYNRTKRRGGTAVD